MKIRSLSKLLFIHVPLTLLITGFSLQAQVFPQQAINEALMDNQFFTMPSGAGKPQSSAPSGIFALLKETPGKVSKISGRLAGTGFNPLSDTVFVGEVPNDTLVISGNYFNNGPILVFTDGVLIFNNATATILGDIFVFQNGKLFADSSVISSPQQYFYQRSMIIANNGYVSISNSTLDFGGLSHNLAVVNNGSIEMTNVTNIGFTTAGAYGNASISIDSTNQAGEFIMTDSCELSFSNANTVLLWHHIPDSAVVDVTFPSGSNVPGYIFNNNQPGVNGIGYNVQVSNCTDVMWALMPENGSDVTITGSALRAIGLWFTGSDTAAVSGLVNNSNYTAFSAPLSDRVLQLNTTSVQTWSLYLFNSTVMNATGCIVGEVGTMGTSFLTAQGILCDGSGGYYWATDTTLSIAVNTTVLGYIRSQGNGIVLLGYGSSTAGASAIGNSVMVVTQSSLPQDPVAFEKGTAWRVHIDPPQNLFVDTMVNITGSAWIDQGPMGSFMDFGFYTVEYKPAAGSNWLPVATANTSEVHSSLLTQWNTNGLTPGGYQLRLNTQNDLGDSIDAVIQVTLLPSVLGEGEISAGDMAQMLTWYDAISGNVVVNISSEDEIPGEISIFDVNGKLLFSKSCQLSRGDQIINIPFIGFPAGMYIVDINSKALSARSRLRVIQ